MSVVRGSICALYDCKSSSVPREGSLRAPLRLLGLRSPVCFRINSPRLTSQRSSFNTASIDYTQSPALSSHRLYTTSTPASSQASSSSALTCFLPQVPIAKFNSLKRGSNRCSNTTVYRSLVSYTTRETSRDWMVGGKSRRKGGEVEGRVGLGARRAGESEVMKGGEMGDGVVCLEEIRHVDAVEVG